MMRFSIKHLGFLCLLATFLLSCTPAPTQNPLSTQPLTDGATIIRAEAAPLALTPPAGYRVDNGKVGLTINRVGEAGAMLIGVRITPKSGQSADQLIENYMRDLPAGWNHLIENETAGGLPGRGSRYSLETGSDKFLTGRIIALTSTTRDYLIFAVMDREDWISQGSADFSTMLNTIEIDETGVNLPATDPEPEAEAEIVVPSPTSTPYFQGIPEFAGNSAAGYACFSGFDTGLNCILPDGSWVQYTENNSPLPRDTIFDMTSCPDGRILMVDATGIIVFDGTTFAAVQQPDRYGLPDEVGCGPNGEIWLTYFRGVALFRNKDWEFFEKSEVVKDAETVFQGIEIAPDGTAWIMSFNEVATLSPDQSEWTIYAEGSGFNDTFYFDGLALDSAGTPYLSHSDGYIWFDDNQWYTQEVDSGFFGNLEVTTDQKVYLGTFAKGVIISDSGAGSTAQTTADGLSRNNIDLIDSDDRGRVWLTTETGIDIFDGKRWTQLRMDNSALAHNRFQSFVVIGAGPEIPPTNPEPAGSLTGQLTHPDGTPLANSAVTLCLNGFVSFSDPEESPCLNSVEVFTAQTDSNGTFLIDEIPSAWYKLFFEIDGIWQELEDDDGFLTELLLIESGQITDIGTRQATEE